MRIAVSLAVSLLLGFTGGVLVSAEDALPLNEYKKRDPFVALVHPDGKIKSKEELFPVTRRSSLSMNIVLNAIIWDKERPLAMINKKIYGEGKEITEGLIVEKINQNDVVLNDNGVSVTIPLRETEKKDE